jgi:hypothetical protein
LIETCLHENKILLQGDKNKFFETGNILFLESVYKLRFPVIPAEAGIQKPLNLPDSRLHGNDKQAVYKQTLFRF